MPDAVGINEKIKKAALGAMESSKPVNVYFGEVISTSPLKINVEQKMVLSEAQLILTRNVTNFVTMVMMNWETEESLEAQHKHTLIGNTEDGGDPEHNHVLNRDTNAVNLNHSHILAGGKQVIIQNALDIGEQVIMIRQQEGQKFIVVDRIGGR